MAAPAPANDNASRNAFEPPSWIPIAIIGGGITGLAFNLEENSVGVIILGDYLKVTEGDEVRSTGKLLSVPVGAAVIGRVVDPLGPLRSRLSRVGFRGRPAL